MWKNEIYFIKITQEREIIFKCLYKIFPYSLKEICKNFLKLKKKTFPEIFIQFENLEFVGPVPDLKYFLSNADYEEFLTSHKIFNFKKDIIEFCSEEVGIIPIVINFLKLIMKPLKVSTSDVNSIASLSYKIFIKKFNNFNLILRSSPIFDKMHRPSYFGGRCEVYGNAIELEKIYHFDFSGMYGQCMLEKFVFGPYKVYTEIYEVGDIGFYWIRGETLGKYPVLPHKAKFSKKLMFTEGIIDGLYWHEEIIEAIKSGFILKEIKFLIKFEKYDFVFKDFINYFNEVKEKNKFGKVLSKLIINSLYGRLGMMESSEHSHIIRKNLLEFYLKETNVISYKEINNFVLINNEIDFKLKKILSLKKINPFNNVALASIITAKGRVKLLKAQQEVINNGGRLLYSDTDSIIASYKYPVDNQIHGEVSWDTSNEHTRIKKAVFLKPRTYLIEYENGDMSARIHGKSVTHIKSFDDLIEQQNLYKKEIY